MKKTNLKQTIIPTYANKELLLKRFSAKDDQLHVGHEKTKQDKQKCPFNMKMFRFRLKNSMKKYQEHLKKKMEIEKLSINNLNLNVDNVHKRNSGFFHKRSLSTQDQRPQICQLSNDKKKLVVVPKPNSIEPSAISTVKQMSKKRRNSVVSPKTNVQSKGFFSTNRNLRNFDIEQRDKIAQNLATLNPILGSKLKIFNLVHCSLNDIWNDKK
eukprot:CAMPEP_0168335102 /NCGR_PEP_ID=MMETSP0213-20121227/10698_1 /TAXON_ID=151035 /ORGANISM="Euplotes harpa, Strain FSP1.4" /LENGTH=211 /DNA_ID=CAMNT_0008339943 /DNA_START=34 /DNA_END=669 /DNA_ORIENTATION=+